MGLQKVREKGRGIRGNNDHEFSKISVGHKATVQEAHGTLVGINVKHYSRHIKTSRNQRQVLGMKMIWLQNVTLIISIGWLIWLPMRLSPVFSHWSICSPPRAACLFKEHDLIEEDHSLVNCI